MCLGPLSVQKTLADIYVLEEEKNLCFCFCFHSKGLISSFKVRSFAGLDDVVFSSVLAPVGKVSIPEPPFYKAFRLLKREKKKRVFKLGRSGSSIYVKRKKLKTERGSLFSFFFFPFLLLF